MNFASPRVQRMPRMQTMGDKLVVHGREQVSAEATSASFVAGNFWLDPAATVGSSPAVPVTPWLYRIATCFNKYLFRQARFIYEPFCSTTTSGRIMASYTTDYADGQPSTANNLLQYSQSVTSPVWSPFVCNFRPSVRREYNVEPTEVTADSVQGQFFYALDNGPSTSVGSGIVHIEYVIELWDRASYVNNE